MPCRVLQGDEVQPAGAAAASGRGAVLVSAVDDAVADLVALEQLGREGAGADAGRVGLRDTPHLVDVARPDAGSDAGRRADRVRRRHERIRAVVDVQQRALRALEQHELAVVQRSPRERAGVGDVLLEPVTVGHEVQRHLLEVELLGELGVALERAQHELLGLQRRHDLLLQDLLVEQVLDADTQTRGLVGVRGADPALRRADLVLAQAVLAGPVEDAVVGGDDVGVGADLQAAHVDAALAQAVDLAGEDGRVDDDAVADDAGLARVQDARGDEVELPRLVAVDDRVTCVVAALEADDGVGARGQQIDDLALPLVTPLRADDDGAWHEGEESTEPASRAGRTIAPPDQVPLCSQSATEGEADRTRRPRGDRALRPPATLVGTEDREDLAHLFQPADGAIGDLLRERVAVEVRRQDDRALFLVAGVDDRVELLQHPRTGLLRADVVDVEEVDLGRGGPGGSVYECSVSSSNVVRISASRRGSE